MLADTIRNLDQDAVADRKARALIYGLSTLAAIIQGAELEKRVAALEARKEGSP